MDSNDSTSAVELKSDPASEERDAELVEADALPGGLGGELRVQVGGHAEDELPTGVHRRNSTACSIDPVSTTCDTTGMETTAVSISVELTREELFLLAGAIRQQAEHQEEIGAPDKAEIKALHDRATALYNKG